MDKNEGKCIHPDIKRAINCICRVKSRVWERDPCSHKPSFLACSELGFITRDKIFPSATKQTPGNVNGFLLLMASSGPKACWGINHWQETILRVSFQEDRIIGARRAEGCRNQNGTQKNRKEMDSMSHLNNGDYTLMLQTCNQPIISKRAQWILGGEYRWRRRKDLGWERNEKEAT